MKCSRLPSVCAHLCIYMNTATGFPASVAEDPEATEMNGNYHRRGKIQKRITGEFRQVTGTRFLLGLGDSEHLLKCTDNMDLCHLKHVLTIGNANTAISVFSH